MGITERAVKNPAAVAVAVAIVTLFGLFSLGRLPVQLFPDIELPQLTVFAGWRAASPREIESEIIEPMEDVLQGVTGMQINLGALTSRPVLIFGAVYTVVAFVAKVAGCGLPSMLAGFNLRGAARVGFGMMPRGEVGLIFASIGAGLVIGAERVVDSGLAFMAVSLDANDAAIHDRSRGKPGAWAQAVN